MASSVGYVGKADDNAHPVTYKTVCSGDGNTEALRLEYDPNQISYEQLIREVLSDATPGRCKPQYMSAVWAQNDEQKQTAKRVATELRKGDVPVLPPKPFHDAEDYHQKYYAKMR